MDHGENAVSTKKSPGFGALKISANNPASAIVPPAAPAAEPAIEHEVEHEVEHEAVERAPAAKKAAGKVKPPKTIPVRMTHEQWYEAKEFGMREDQSLQELFIAGLNMLRASKGLPPLTGTRLK
jgi:hypothetical protein